MRTLVNYCLPIPEARLLASMESVKQDLGKVIQLSHALEAVLGQDQPDPLMLDALSIALVVRYARCFSSGSRQGLSHDLPTKGPQGMVQLHRHVIDLRSKHVAHSVNTFDDTNVTVTLLEDGKGETSIWGINVAHSSVIGLAPESVPRIRELAAWILSEAETVMKQERERLLPIARQLGVERIKEFGTPTIEGIRFDEPSRRRTKA